MNLILSICIQTTAQIADNEKWIKTCTQYYESDCFRVKYRTKRTQKYAARRWPRANAVDQSYLFDVCGYYLANWCTNQRQTIWFVREHWLPPHPHIYRAHYSKRTHIDTQYIRYVFLFRIILLTQTNVLINGIVDFCFVGILCTFVLLVGYFRGKFSSIRFNSIMSMCVCVCVLAHTHTKRCFYMDHSIRSKRGASPRAA